MIRNVAHKYSALISRLIGSCISRRQKRELVFQEDKSIGSLKLGKRRWELKHEQVLVPRNYEERQLWPLLLVSKKHEHKLHLQLLFLFSPTSSLWGFQRSTCLCMAMAACPAQSSGHPQVTMIGSQAFGPLEMLAVDRVLPSCTPWIQHALPSRLLHKDCIHTDLGLGLSPAAPNRMVVCWGGLEEMLHAWTVAFPPPFGPPAH